MQLLCLAKAWPSSAGAGVSLHNTLAGISGSCIKPHQETLDEAYTKLS